VSWLYYADRLMEFPPACSAWRWAHPAAEPGQVSFRSGDRQFRACSTGTAADPDAGAARGCGAGGAGVPLVTTLFHYGEFAARDVWMTRQALAAYSVGLLGLILVKVLAPGSMRGRISAPRSRSPS